MPLNVKKSLAELGLSEKEIKVYLALTELGEAPASKVAKKTGLPRTTVISILNHLAEDNYLSLNHYKGLTYYWVESPKVLQSSLEHQMVLAGELSEALSELYRSEANFPFANIYDTKKSIKNFIEKLLINLPKKSVIYTIDAPHQGNYQKIFSDDFNRIMLGLKRKKEIVTKTLIPFGTYQVIAGEKISAQKIEIREMPEKIVFNASIWFIDDLLVLFSGKPPFVVAAHHHVINSSLKSIYDFLWQLSAPKH